MDVKPSWLLDIDGVLNPVGRKPPKHVHKEWVCADVIDPGNGRSWPIKVAVPVIEFVNMIHDQKYANIIWHTTWQHGADEVAAAVGLPRGLPILDAPEFAAWNHRTAVGWWKTAPVQRHLDMTTAPTLWIDDDLDDETWVVKLRAPKFIKVIAPDRHSGLTSEHLEEIFAFLAQPHIPEEGRS
jgi:Swiss Army Knife RNA repair-like protein